MEREMAMTETTTTPRVSAVEPPHLNNGGLNRARLRELIDLAYETVDWLESKGLKQGEQCAFREAAERIWFTPKGDK